MEQGILQPFGLDLVAERVYLALLAEPADVDGLSDRSGLAASQIRASLKTLAALRLVRQSVDVPGQWNHVGPGMGLAVLMHELEADLARRQQELAAARAAAAIAIVAYEAAYPPAAQVERLLGRDSVEGQVKILLKSAVCEVCVVSGPMAGTWISRLADSPPANGVTFKVLHHDNIRSDPEALASAAQQAGAGFQVRTARVLPPLLAVCDREAALLPAGPGQAGDGGAIWVREPAVAAALAALFGFAWETAVPLDGMVPESGADGLTPGEQALLMLLGAGLTDAAVASRLGSSPRTVRRQMAVLMRRLDASSRFQAGHKAGRRGWI